MSNLWYPIGRCTEFGQRRIFKKFFRSEEQPATPVTGNNAEDRTVKEFLLDAAKLAVGAICSLVANFLLALLLGYIGGNWRSMFWLFLTVDSTFGLLFVNTFIRWITWAYKLKFPACTSEDVAQLFKGKYDDQFDPNNPFDFLAEDTRLQHATAVVDKCIRASVKDRKKSGTEEQEEKLGEESYQLLVTGLKADAGIGSGKLKRILRQQLEFDGDKYPPTLAWKNIISLREELIKNQPQIKLWNAYVTQMKAWLTVILCCKLVSFTLAWFLSLVLDVEAYLAIVQRLGEVIMILFYTLQIWVQEQALMRAKAASGNPAKTSLDRCIIAFFERAWANILWASRGCWLADKEESAQDKRDPAVAQPTPEEDEAIERPEQESMVITSTVRQSLKSQTPVESTDNIFRSTEKLTWIEWTMDRCDQWLGLFENLSTHEEKVFTETIALVKESLRMDDARQAKEHLEKGLQEKYQERKDTSLDTAAQRTEAALQEKQSAAAQLREANAALELAKDIKGEATNEPGSPSSPSGPSPSLRRKKERSPSVNIDESNMRLAQEQLDLAKERHREADTKWSSQQEHETRLVAEESLMDVLRRYGWSGERFVGQPPMPLRKLLQDLEEALREAELAKDRESDPEGNDEEALPNYETGKGDALLKRKKTLLLSRSKSRITGMAVHNFVKTAFGPLRERWFGNRRAAKKIGVMVAAGSIGATCLTLLSFFTECRNMQGSDIDLNNQLLHGFRMRNDLRRLDQTNLPRYKDHMFVFDGSQHNALTVPRQANEFAESFSFIFLLRTEAACGLQPCPIMSTDGRPPSEIETDFALNVTGGKLVFSVFTASTSTDLETMHEVSSGRSYAIAALWDKTSGKSQLYVDGKLQASGTGSNYRLKTFDNVRVGSDALGGHFFSGSISSMYLYQRSLRDIEVKALATENGHAGEQKVCPMFMPAGVYKLFDTIFGGSTQSLFLAIAFNAEARWLYILRKLQGYVDVPDWGIFTYFHNLNHISGRPAGMQYILTERIASPLSKAQRKDRAAFWSFVLFVEVALVLASTKFWHFIFITLPVRWKLVKQHEENWKPYKVKNLFVQYHVAHNLYLFLIMQVAVINGFLNRVTGLDWECWSNWVDWLLFFLNGTAILKYSANMGTNMSHAWGDIIMLLVPGLGNDIHLAKDWIFIALCFDRAYTCTNTPSAFFAYFLAVASIVSLFLPLPELLRNQQDAESFIASHWPILMTISDAASVIEEPTPIEIAQPTEQITEGDLDQYVRQELQELKESHIVQGETENDFFSKRVTIKTKDGTVKKITISSKGELETKKSDLADFPLVAVVEPRAAQRGCLSWPAWKQYFGGALTKNLNAQTTQAKQVVAEQNELPQACFEILFAVFYESSRAIWFMIFFSLLKVFLIPIGRSFLVRWIQLIGDAPALLSFGKEHGDISEFEYSSHALHVAAGNGRVGGVETPLKTRAGWKLTRSSANRLCSAVPMLLRMAQMLDRQRNVKSINKKNARGMTPIMVATYHAPNPKVYMQVVLQIVEKLGNPNDTGTHGRSALQENGRNALQVLDALLASPLITPPESQAPDADAVHLTVSEGDGEKSRKAGGVDAQWKQVEAQWKQARKFLKSLCDFSSKLSKLPAGMRGAPLLWAAQKGDFEMFKLMVSAGASVKISNVRLDSKSPLHLALQGGNANICRFLINGAADILAKDRHNRNPLHEAARADSLVELRARADSMLEHEYESVKDRGDACQVLLEMASQKGKSYLEALVMEKDWDPITRESATALHWAALSEQVNICRAILSIASKNNLSPYCVTDQCGQTALHWAAGSRNKCVAQEAKTITKMLVYYNAELDVKDDNNPSQTPLDFNFDHGEVRKGLLNEPCSGEAVGQTPLVATIRGRQCKLFSYLLEMGASLDSQQFDALKQTALHHAAACGEYDMCEKLILAKASVHLKDTNRRTPLHLAAYEDASDVCKLLLRGYDAKEAEDEDVEHQTPLGLAAAKGHVHVCQELVTFNSCKALGDALWCAVKFGKGANCCKVLCDELVAKKGDINEATPLYVERASAGEDIQFDDDIGLPKSVPQNVPQSNVLDDDFELPDLFGDDIEVGDAELPQSVPQNAPQTDLLLEAVKLDTESRDHICQILVAYRAKLKQCHLDAAADAGHPQTQTNLIHSWSCRSGVPPLGVASAEGEYDIVQLLLRNKAEPGHQFPYKDEEDNDQEFRTTSFHLAVSSKRDTCENIVKLHIEEFGSMTGEGTSHLIPPNRQTPQEEKVSPLKIRDSKNRLPLHLAAMDGKTNVCKVLIDARASADGRDDGMLTVTPLQMHIAEGGCNVELCQLLVDGSEQLDVGDSETLSTALHFAVKFSPDGESGMEDQTKKQDLLNTKLARLFKASSSGIAKQAALVQKDSRLAPGRETSLAVKKDDTAAAGGVLSKASEQDETSGAAQVGAASAAPSEEHHRRTAFEEAKAKSAAGQARAKKAFYEVRARRAAALERVRQRNAEQVPAPSISRPLERTPVVEPAQAPSISRPLQRTPVVEPAHAPSISRPLARTAFVEPAQAPSISKPLERTTVVEPAQAPSISRPLERTAVVEPPQKMTDAARAEQAIARMKRALLRAQQARKVAQQARERRLRLEAERVEKFKRICSMMVTKRFPILAVSNKQGQSPIQLAENKTWLLEHLLASSDVPGLSALHKASADGREKLVKDLLAHRADANEKSKAVDDDDFERLQSSGLSISLVEELKTKACLWPLQLATSSGHKTVCEYLVNADASFEGDSLAHDLMKRAQDSDPEGNSSKVYLYMQDVLSPPLIRVAQNGDIEQLQKIINGLKNYNDYGHWDRELYIKDRRKLIEVDAFGGKTALQYAVEIGNYEICKMLFEECNFSQVRPNDSNWWYVFPKYEDVRVKSKSGQTALHLAAESGHLQICRLLVGDPMPDVYRQVFLFDCDARGLVPLACATLVEKGLSSADRDNSKVCEFLQNLHNMRSPEAEYEPPFTDCVRAILPRRRSSQEGYSRETIHPGIELKQEGGIFSVSEINAEGTASNWNVCASNQNQQIELESRVLALNRNPYTARWKIRVALAYDQIWILDLLPKAVAERLLADLWDTIGSATFQSMIDGDPRIHIQKQEDPKPFDDEFNSRFAAEQKLQSAREIVGSKDLKEALDKVKGIKVDTDTYQAEYSKRNDAERMLDEAFHDSTLGCSVLQGALDKIRDMAVDTKVDISKVNDEIRKRQAAEKKLAEVLASGTLGSGILQEALKDVQDVNVDKEAAADELKKRVAAEVAIVEALPKVGSEVLQKVLTDVVKDTKVDRSTIHDQITKRQAAEKKLAEALASGTPGSGILQAALKDVQDVNVDRQAAADELKKREDAEQAIRQALESEEVVGSVSLENALKEVD